MKIDNIMWRKHLKFRLKSRLCRVAGYWWSEVVDYEPERFIVDVCNCE